MDYSIRIKHIDGKSGIEVTIFGFIDKDNEFIVSKHYYECNHVTKEMINELIVAVNKKLKPFNKQLKTIK